MQLHVIAIVRSLAAYHRATITNTRKHTKAFTRPFEALKKTCKDLAKPTRTSASTKVFELPFKGLQRPMKTVPRSSFKGDCKGLYKVIEKTF